jgi:hypothetical protein
VNHTGVLTGVASTLGGKRELFTRTKCFSTIVTIDGTVAEVCAVVVLCVLCKFSTKDSDLWLAAF